MPRAPSVIRRDRHLNILVSESEVARLDAHVRATGTDRSQVLRRWIREMPLPIAEARPVAWVSRPCETCGEEMHVREDLDGPHLCAKHERRLRRVVPIAKARKGKP